MSTPDPDPSGPRPRRRHRSAAVVSALLVLALLVGAGWGARAGADNGPGEHRGTSAPAGGPQVRPDLPGDGACPFDTSGFDLALECGRVDVVADRDTGRGRISLFVTVARRPTEPTAPPLLLLAGGPGEGGAASFAGLLRGDVAPRLTAGRDLVVVDHRGTGLSEPRLECPIIDPAVLGDPARARAVGEQCAREYRDAGIDAADYTTTAAAQDLVDVRRALGSPRWDVYGVSYGTTLALDLLRRPGNGVDRAVLDSVSPVQDNTLAVDVAAKDSFLRTLIEDCARDRACDRAHPDLGTRLTAGIDELNRRPLDLGGTAVTGDALLFFATNTAYATRENRPGLPGVLDAAISGDPGPLAELLGSAEEDTELPAELADSAGADGLGLVVSCASDASRFARDVARQPGPRSPYAAALTRLTTNYLNACPPFGLPRPPADPPVRAGRPVLLLSGEDDPSTPPANAERAARTLRNSTQVIVPDEGHAVLLAAPPDGCLTTLVTAFLDRPATRPDTRCLRSEYPPLPLR